MKTNKLRDVPERIKIRKVIDEYRDKIPTSIPDITEEEGYSHLFKTKILKGVTRLGESYDILKAYVVINNGKEVPRFLIRFEDTGFCRTAHSSSIFRSVNDPWYPSIGDRVCQGDYVYSTDDEYSHKARTKLYDMLARLPKDIIICPRWRILSNIMEDLRKEYEPYQLCDSKFAIQSKTHLNISTLKLLPNGYNDVDISELEIDRSDLRYEKYMPEFDLVDELLKLKYPTKIPTLELRDNIDVSRGGKETKNGGKYYVVGYKPNGKVYIDPETNSTVIRNDYIIQFKLTGYIKSVEVLNSGIKDPWHPATKGIGCLGDTKISCDPINANLRKIIQ